MTFLEKIFLACALSGSVVFFIRMLLMFAGLAGGADDVDGVHDLSDGHDIAGELTDDIHSDAAFDMDAVESHDTDLVLHEHSGEHPLVSDSDVSFHFVSIQGLTAFLMMFGWVGLAMLRDSLLPGWIAVLSGTAAGFLTVWILAQIFRFVASLQSDGTIRVQRALGSGGTVYLRIPADGSGQVQVEVDGRLRTFDAVSAKKEEIKTGEQITVVWVQDNGVLVVEKDRRDEGGRLCGL
jgi:membrane protein implicated in regulation of membrane protease activity